MIVLFLMDDGSFKAVQAEQLQLRQLEPGKTVLGIPEGDKFLPFISYPINILPANNNTIDALPTEDVEKQ
jgi:hypothetical protein